MAEIDTSSYRQPPQPGALDVLQKVQGVQANKLAIDRAQLANINQGYEYLLRELNSLPPDAGPDQYRQFAQNAVKLKIVTPEIATTFLGSIPTDPTKMRGFRDSIAGKLLDTQSAINFQYGVPGMVGNGQSNTPVAVSPRFAGPQVRGAPIQQQPPIGQETKDVDPNSPTYGAPSTIGAMRPTMPPGTVQQPGGLPGQYQDAPSVAPPAAPRAPGSGLSGAAVPPSDPAMIVPPSQVAAANAPTSFDQRIGAAASTGRIPTGLPTGEAEAIHGDTTQLNADRQAAPQKLLAVMPLKRALTLIPQTMTGIASEQFNTIRAGLIQAGIITPEANDPTIVYQELNKVLANYVSRSPIAARSDAAQALAESANPNSKKMLNQSLIKVARDAIAYERMEAAVPNMWEGPSSGRGYNKFRSDQIKKFDPRAFNIDMLPQEDRVKLIQDMQKDAKSTNKKTREDALKFFNSLQTAEKALNVTP